MRLKCRRWLVNHRLEAKSGNQLMWRKLPSHHPSFLCSPLPPFSHLLLVFREHHPHQMPPSQRSPRLSLTRSPSAERQSHLRTNVEKKGGGEETTDRKIKGLMREMSWVGSGKKSLVGDVKRGGGKWPGEGRWGVCGGGGCGRCWELQRSVSSVSSGLTFRSIWSRAWRKFCFCFSEDCVFCMTTR